MPAGNEIRGPQDGAQRGGVDRARVLQPHDVLQVHDADDVVELVLVRGQPRVIRRRELLLEMRRLRIEVEGMDLVARRHHVIDRDRLDVEQVGEHRPVLAAEVLGLEHERAQLLLRQRRPGLARGLAVGAAGRARGRRDWGARRPGPPPRSSGARTYATGGAMRSACAAPITLGRISEKIRIASEIAIVDSASASSPCPNSRTAISVDSVAAAALTTVLPSRMTESSLSVCASSDSTSFAPRAPRCARCRSR